MLIILNVPSHMGARKIWDFFDFENFKVLEKPEDETKAFIYEQIIKYWKKELASIWVSQMDRIRVPSTLH
jgi:hypothetical protein